MKKRIASLEKRPSEKRTFKARFCTFEKPADRDRRSLGTKDETVAQVIVNDIQWLMDRRLKAEHPDALQKHPTSYKLYYGTEVFYKTTGKKNDVDGLDTETINGTEYVSMNDYNKMKVQTYNELQAEQKLRKKYQADFKEIEKQYNRLSKNVDAMEFMAQEKVPGSREIYDQYYKFQERKTVDFKPKTSPINKMFEFLKWEHVSKITTEDVRNYLDHYEKNGITSPNASSDTSLAYNKCRNRIEWFFNWLEVQYEVRNPVKKKIVAIRIDKKVEAGHHLSQVERDTEIARAEQDLGIYGKAWVATAFMMGLSAHEQRGLMRDDLFPSHDEKTGERKLMIKVANNNYRSLKAKARPRVFEVPPALEPILKEYLESEFIREDSLFLFEQVSKPKAGCHVVLNKPNMQNRCWHEGTLTHVLNRGENPFYSKNINSLVTRRTFGYLLKLDGWEDSAIAKVMGNSAKMVNEHYSCITSSEIRMNKNK